MKRFLSSCACLRRVGFAVGVVLAAFAAFGRTAAHAGTVYSISNSLSGTSVQNGWTVSGSIELQDNTAFGTITDSDIKSWQWTATKENTTLSANSAAGRIQSFGLNATAAGLYMPTTMGVLFLSESFGPYDISLKWQTFPQSQFQLDDQATSGIQFLVQPMDFPIDNAYGYQFATLAVPLPEPATYAMALAGLACGGYSLFRRRLAR